MSSFLGGGGNPEVRRSWGRDVEEIWGGNFSPLPCLGEEKVKILEGQKIKWTFGATYHGHPQVLFRFTQTSSHHKFSWPSPKKFNSETIKTSAHLGRFTHFASHPMPSPRKINTSQNRFASDGKDQVSTRSIGLKELLLGSRNLHTKSIQDRCPEAEAPKRPIFWKGRKPFFQNACARTSRKRVRVRVGHGLPACGRISVEDSFTNQQKHHFPKPNPLLPGTFPSRFFVVCEDFYWLQKLSVGKPPLSQPTTTPNGLILELQFAANCLRKAPKTYHNRTQKHQRKIDFNGYNRSSKSSSPLFSRQNCCFWMFFLVLSHLCVHVSSKKWLVW